MCVGGGGVEVIIAIIVCIKFNSMHPHCYKLVRTSLETKSIEGNYTLQTKVCLFVHYLTQSLCTRDVHREERELLPSEIITNS